MKAKTLIELLTLSSNLYLISKDKEFFEKVQEIAKKGKKKAEDFFEDLTDADEEGEHSIIEKLLSKAKQAKEELEHKIEETAAKVYKKMHIAHTDEVKKLCEQIENLENKINLLEVRLAKTEGIPTK